MKSCSVSPMTGFAPLASVIKTSQRTSEVSTLITSCDMSFSVFRWLSSLFIPSVVLVPGLLRLEPKVGGFWALVCARMWAEIQISLTSKITNRVVSTHLLFMSPPGIENVTIEDKKHTALRVRCMPLLGAGRVSAPSETSRSTPHGQAQLE